MIVISRILLSYNKSGCGGSQPPRPTLTRDTNLIEVIILVRLQLSFPRGSNSDIQSLSGSSAKWPFKRTAAIGLDVPSHARATAIQTGAPKDMRGTLGDEYGIAHDALIAVGVPAGIAEARVNAAVAYFEALGYGSGTKTRIPGQRSRTKGALTGGAVGWFGINVFGGKEAAEQSGGSASSNNENDMGGDYGTRDYK